MILQVGKNEEFAKWFGQWISVSDSRTSDGHISIQEDSQSRPVEPIILPPEQPPGFTEFGSAADGTPLASKVITSSLPVIQENLASKLYP